MASNSEFFAKYSDPRWQRKRLEIMQREDFSCERCGSKDSTLNVHHAFYRRGKDPWEYADGMLHCYCKPCHDEFHVEKEQALFFMSQCDSDEIKAILGYIASVANAKSASSFVITDLPTAYGFCDFWGIHPKMADELVGEWCDETTARELKQSGYSR